MAIIDVETQNQKARNLMKLQANVVAGARYQRCLHLDYVAF